MPVASLPETIFPRGGASGSGGPHGKRNGQFRHGERTKAVSLFAAGIVSHGHHRWWGGRNPWRNTSLSILR